MCGSAKGFILPASLLDAQPFSASITFCALSEGATAWLQSRVLGRQREKLQVQGFASCVDLLHQSCVSSQKERSCSLHHIGLLPPGTFVPPA